MYGIPLLLSDVYKCDVSSPLFVQMYFQVTPSENWVG